MDRGTAGTERQLRIRARSAAGRVAGAANYKHGLAARRARTACPYVFPEGPCSGRSHRMPDARRRTSGTTRGPPRHFSKQSCAGNGAECRSAARHANRIVPRSRVANLPLRNVCMSRSAQSAGRHNRRYRALPPSGTRDPATAMVMSLRASARVCSSPALCQ
jgi:hypothetical protein